MKTLVTGAAGFIGAAVARLLLDGGDEVVGVDSLNDYYSPDLKRARLALLEGREGFAFRHLDLAEPSDLFDAGFDRVVHLAAQAGVRYSLDNPAVYLQANAVAFGNVLEGCRRAAVRHLVYASSSSVYGMNARMPFSTADRADHPVSLYAATKRANELMAHSYSHLFRLPTTGLRFFTVYGPWGRPDMAAMLFASAIAEGRPIRIFNHGRLKRDFTYVDDIARGVVMALDRPPQGDPAWTVETGDPARSTAPWRLYNIGNSDPVELGRFVELVEKAMGRPAIKEYLDMQPGDVLATYAEVSDLEREVGFRPSTPIEEGIERFAAWFKAYYGIA